MIFTKTKLIMISLLLKASELIFILDLNIYILMVTTVTFLLYMTLLKLYILFFFTIKELAHKPGFFLIITCNSNMLIIQIVS